MHHIGICNALCALLELTLALVIPIYLLRNFIFNIGRFAYLNLPSYLAGWEGQEIAHVCAQMTSTSPSTWQKGTNHDDCNQIINRKVTAQFMAVVVFMIVTCIYNAGTLLVRCIWWRWWRWCTGVNGTNGTTLMVELSDKLAPYCCVAPSFALSPQRKPNQ